MSNFIDAPQPATPLDGQQADAVKRQKFKEAQLKRFTAALALANQTDAEILTELANRRPK